MFFRKKYLPDLTIHQDSKTGKYFAQGVDKYDISVKFCEYVDPKGGDKYAVSPYGVTLYETIDSLVKALYEYASEEHLKYIHKELTFMTVKIKL